MKKKSIIILSIVVAICAIGLLASQVLNWPVNENNTSGNIGKSSRFSRKTATVRIDNMEELLRTDEDYKNSIVLAYSIMQTRAIQFGNLVDMSNKAAGDIPEFEGVLKEMNEQATLYTNVANALVEAGNNLDTVVSGTSCPDVTQSTINASLSYTTLQKQNYLADSFIDTTDKYIQKAEASEELMLVRDLWVEYQEVTASLEGDVKAAKALDKKGALLTPEQALKAADSFDQINKLALAQGEELLNLLLPVDVHDVFRNNVDLGVDQFVIQNTETNDHSLGMSNPGSFRMPVIYNTVKELDQVLEMLISQRIQSTLGVHRPSYATIFKNNPADVFQDLNMVIYQTAEGNVATLSGGPRVDR